MTLASLGYQAHVGLAFVFTTIGFYLLYIKNKLNIENIRRNEENIFLFHNRQMDVS